MSHQTPQPGDLLVAPSGSFHGKIVCVNPETGEYFTAFSGGELADRSVWGMEIDQRGQLLVALPDKIVRIEPLTGTQTVVAGPCDIFTGPSYWYDLAQAEGTLFAVTDSPARLVRVDEATSELHEVDLGFGPNDWGPTAIEPPRGGQPYLFNHNSHSLMTFDASSGTHTVLARIGYLRDFVVAPDRTVFFTRGSTDVLQVDPESEAVSVISSGGSLVNSFGIALDSMGIPVVTDLASGALVRIDPRTGEQRTLVKEGGLASPANIVALPAKLE